MNKKRWTVQPDSHGFRIVWVGEQPAPDGIDGIFRSHERAIAVCRALNLTERHEGAKRWEGFLDRLAGSSTSTGVIHV